MFIYTVDCCASPSAFAFSCSCFKTAAGSAINYKKAPTVRETTIGSPRPNGNKRN